ncbi:MAG TPA: hypothetical protein VGS41_07450, partial [Chthonomonadales bacterium]|nr:hypothetical protein [Chthonomonadales bacterium]
MMRHSNLKTGWCLLVLVTVGAPAAAQDASGQQPGALPGQSVSAGATTSGTVTTGARKAAAAPALPAVDEGGFPREMAMRMRDIVALRRINSLQLTPEEIGKVLTVFKQMRSAEQAHRASALQILDTQKQALLAEPPGAAPPPDPGRQLQQLEQSFQQQIQPGWVTLVQIVGPDRAGALRSLVQHGMVGSPGPGGRYPAQPGFGSQGFGQGGLGFPGSPYNMPVPPGYNGPGFSGGGFGGPPAAFPGYSGQAPGWQGPASPPGMRPSGPALSFTQLVSL